MSQSLVNERSGEVVEVPEGENLIGRGPLFKVKAVHHKLNGWCVSLLVVSGRVCSLVMFHL